MSYEIEEMAGILKTSDRHNRQDAITGALVLINGRFIQALEGETTQVDGLFRRIKTDKRHQGVMVLGEWPIATRLFTGWEMARLDASAVSPSVAEFLVEAKCGIQVTGTLAALAKQMSDPVH